MGESTSEPLSGIPAGPPEMPQATDVAEGIRSGDRALLARAITLLESSRVQDRIKAEDILRSCSEGSGLRIGITGAPGVGKSTFIDALGSLLVARGLRVAVLSVDPSSRATGGSILGDKTRMPRLAGHPGAFIRSSPSGGVLGGITPTTRGAIQLCEAAGFAFVLVETVGVGQSELAARAVTDIVLLLVQPGSGDELQGIKRGIVEIADLLVVTKADGDNMQQASQTQRHYRRAAALHTGGFRRVETCSALTGAGMESVWRRVERMAEHLRASGKLERRRKAGARDAVMEALELALVSDCLASLEARSMLGELQEAVAAGIMSPLEAARRVIAAYRPVP